jgi:hypothetical protein
MGLRTTLSSHRYLLGGLAAALGLTTAAAPVLADVANAAPTDTTNSTPDYSPQTIGTYESCSAYFGLHKGNSNLASFDIVNNTTGPDPVIADTQQAGPTLVPVVTLTDGSNNVFECTPSLGWTDQATWENPYMGIGLSFLGGTASYPGTGFWTLPAIGYPLDHFDTSLQQWVQYTAVTGTLRFESNLTGVPISSSMTVLPTTNPGFDGNSYLTLFWYQSPYWPDALNFVATAPTGNAAQATLLDAIANGFVNGPTLCDGGGGLAVPNADFAPLVATLKALLPSRPNLLCNDITYDSSWLVDGAIQQAKVANAPVTVTVGDPAPPTTTTTVSPEEPVAPAFTG